jgi:hypothetical protein
MILLFPTALHNKESRNVMLKFNPYSCQYIRWPWLLKPCANVAIEFWIRIESSFTFVLITLLGSEILSLVVIPISNFSTKSCDTKKQSNPARTYLTSWRDRPATLNLQCESSALLVSRLICCYVLASLLSRNSGSPVQFPKCITFPSSCHDLSCTENDKNIPSADGKLNVLTRIRKISNASHFSDKIL